MSFSPVRQGASSSTAAEFLPASYAKESTNVLSLLLRGVIIRPTSL